MLVTLPDIE